MDKTADSTLEKIDTARQLLAQCSTIPKAKKIIDIARTAEIYARRARLSQETIIQALGVRVIAMRMLGAMLKEIDFSTGSKGIGNPKKCGKLCIPHSNGTTLKELGLTKKESSDSQIMSDLTDDEFENVRTGKMSVSRAIRLIKMRRFQEIEKNAVTKAKDNLNYIITRKQSVVKADVLLTDPPYGIMVKEEWDPDSSEIEAFTRGWAKKWSECEADFLLIFFTQKYMWEARKWFDECFNGYQFQQLLIWHYPTNKKTQSPLHFKVSYDPIFFYRKNGCNRKIGVNGTYWGGGNGLHVFDCHTAPIPQINYNEAEMKQHPAQKPVSVMRWLVSATTRIGELVVDPFAGSGTTGIACKQLNRRFYGIEQNSDYRQIAKRRIATYGVNYDAKTEIAAI